VASGGRHILVYVARHMHVMNPTGGPVLHDTNSSCGSNLY
jgi:hypothetical protein